MPTDTSPPRIIEADDVLHLIAELREQNPERAWPSVRQLQQASRNRWELGIGSDRARIMLNRARAFDLPETDSERSVLAERSDRIHALSLIHARDSRARAREALLVQQGGATQRLDDVRQFLTEAFNLGARRGTKAEEVVSDLVAKFQAAERRREALLRGQPEPAREVAPDAQPAPPTTAPDAAPDAYTYRDDPRQRDIEAAIAEAKSTAPDTAPDATLAPAPDAEPAPKPDAAPDANSQMMALLGT